MHYSNTAIAVSGQQDQVYLSTFDPGEFDEFSKVKCPNHERHCLVRCSSRCFIQILKAAQCVAATQLFYLQTNDRIIGLLTPATPSL